MPRIAVIVFVVAALVVWVACGSKSSGASDGGADPCLELEKRCPSCALPELKQRCQETVTARDPESCRNGLDDADLKANCVPGLDAGPVPADAGSEACPAEECPATCASGSCTVCVTTGTCNAACEGGSCSVTCAGGATCNVACGGGGCDMSCAEGARCDFSCAAGSCTFACSTSSGKCSTSCAGGNCTGP
jgi:hypothetical protein